MPTLLIIQVKSPLLRSGTLNTTPTAAIAQVLYCIVSIKQHIISDTE